MVEALAAAAVPALIGATAGAGIGAGSAALRDGDIGKGALVGGAIGGVGAPVAGFLAPSLPLIGSGAGAGATGIGAGAAASGTGGFLSSAGNALSSLPLESLVGIGERLPAGGAEAVTGAQRLGQITGGATQAIAAINSLKSASPTTTSGRTSLQPGQPSPITIGGLTPSFPAAGPSSFDFARQQQIQALLAALANARRA